MPARARRIARDRTTHRSPDGPSRKKNGLGPSGERSRKGGHTRPPIDAAAELVEPGHAEDELQQLSRIGMALMREHDRKALLRRIVAEGKRLTHSDAGGLLLTWQDEEGRLWMRAVLYAVDSLPRVLGAPVSLVPVDDTTIIGHAARTKQALVIADAYDLPRDAVYEQNIAFDERNGYRRRSMLVAPLLDQRERVLGLLLFVNRKIDPRARITSKAAADRYVVQYSPDDVRLAGLLASQAAVAIENARLYARLERNLESFVKASVTAIDLRDPATAGHSLRVAGLATRLAAAIDRATDGPYRDVQFTTRQMRELRFAALLHDFGKVGVREEVLLKAKKLPPLLWERVDARFDLIRVTMELAWCRASAGATAGGAGIAERARRTHDAELAELERCRQVVREANEPSVVDAPPPAELVEISRRTFWRPDGTVAPYLTPDELHFLQLPKGTLDDPERIEVESHVTKTLQYLSDIPWTDDLKHTVAYACRHHEMLDGSGYPDHLSSGDIPLQTRIITLADMFDALTASDRPYKAAVSAEAALGILAGEAEAGRLDAELVRVLRQSKAYRRQERP